MGIEPRTFRFGVRRSTTTPPRSLELFKIVEGVPDDSCQVENIWLQVSEKKTFKGFYHIYMVMGRQAHLILSQI